MTSSKLGLFMVVGQASDSFAFLTVHKNHMPICNEESLERLLDKAEIRRSLNHDEYSTLMTCDNAFDPTVSTRFLPISRKDGWNSN